MCSLFSWISALLIKIIAPEYRLVTYNVIVIQQDIIITKHAHLTRIQVCMVTQDVLWIQQDFRVP